MAARVAADVNRILRTALERLRSERLRLDRQMAAIEAVFRADGVARRRGRLGAAPRGRGRRRMSAARRKALSQRMKAVWAKRHAKRTGAK